MYESHIRCPDDGSEQSPGRGRPAWGGRRHHRPDRTCRARTPAPASGREHARDRIRARVIHKSDGRGDPIDVLLREVIEALRSFLELDHAEIWVLDSEMLRLQVADPPAEA